MSGPEQESSQSAVNDKAPTTDRTQSAEQVRSRDPELLRRQVRALAGMQTLDTVLSAVPSLVLIVNSYRQTVYVNRALAAFLGEVDPATVIGEAPGEVLGCIHAIDDGAVCGSTPFCEYCGANRALRDAWGAVPSVQECRITRSMTDEPPALDLRIWATPVALGDTCYVLMAAADISDEKRRQALERTFFHDILNTATIINGAAKLLVNGPGEDMEEVELLLDHVSDRLVSEIMAQRELVDLENNELEVHPQRIATEPFLGALLASYKRHDLAVDRSLVLDPQTAELEITSDKALLGRVIGNLIKNALEASSPGDTITVGCRALEDTVEFWVHNPQVMPEAVRLQMFKRSFSTKGKGRGLGTYSVKLLTERYLEGTVFFSSAPDKGTTFCVRYPVLPGYAQ